MVFITSEAWKEIKEELLNKQRKKEIKKYKFNLSDELLLLGSKDGIYAWDGEEVIKIVDRENCVRSLYIYQNTLYDTGNYMKVYKTVENEIICKRDTPITHLVEFNKGLYAADKESVFDVKNGYVLAKVKDYVSFLLEYKYKKSNLLCYADTSGVYALFYKNNQLTNILLLDSKLVFPYCGVVHKNRLYIGGQNVIVEIIKNGKIRKTPQIVRERTAYILKVIDNKLYDASGLGIFETLSNKKICELLSFPLAIEKFKNEIYEGEKNGLYNAITREKIFNKSVFCMLTVPATLIKPLL